GLKNNYISLRALSKAGAERRLLPPLLGISSSTWCATQRAIRSSSDPICPSVRPPCHSEIETQRIAMNRKRKPADNAIEIGNKEEHIQLPTRSILICKCLCETWQDLILDHEYAKLHFAQAESYPLARPSNPTRVSRTLYLVEPEDSSDFDFEHSNCTCYDASDFLFNECNGHQFHMNLAKYKIPLRNAEEVLNTHNDGNRKSGTKKKLCIKVCPAGHKYEVVNSCNGLLCLSKPFINDAVVVCNPITGEYIHLPEVLKLEYVKRSIDCGFGFSPKTNQYKVIRISEQGTLDSFRAAEILLTWTLGVFSQFSHLLLNCKESIGSEAIDSALLLWFKNEVWRSSGSAEYKLLEGTRALSLEDEQILSCFPKEVKKEITSEVVSMSYIKQRELEEACRVKKPFCEWLFSPCRKEKVAHSLTGIIQRYMNPPRVWYLDF
ncbi:F-box and associated interaction domains-containing protein, partial [Prunus dulcis]